MASPGYPSVSGVGLVEPDEQHCNSLLPPQLYLVSEPHIATVYPTFSSNFTN